jgi:hypothetical protein
VCLTIESVSEASSDCFLRLPDGEQDAAGVWYFEVCHILLSRAAAANTDDLAPVGLHYPLSLCLM